MFSFYFAGAWSDECNIEPGFQSPYIFPHYERYAIGKGCLSRERTSSGSQVHIINLRRGPPRTSSTDKDNRVVLNIQPDVRTGKCNDFDNLGINVSKLVPLCFYLSSAVVGIVIIVFEFITLHWVATAQGIWMLTFPDRENTGNLVNLIFYTG